MLMNIVLTLLRTSAV